MAAALLVAVALSLPAVASATGEDFVNETLVAKGLGGREIGFELASDSRIDRDYRLQGWFTPELEIGVTRAWVVEATTSFVNRGRGFELAAWRGESRYVLLEQPRWPVSVAGAFEYETETTAAKHISYERLMGTRVLVTRVFAGSLLATFNWGWDRRLVPLPRRGSSQGFGLRFPEDAPITYGFEYRRERLERLTQYGPSVRIRMPNRMRLRLGGFVGEGSHLYRFVGRAVVEADL